MSILLDVPADIVSEILVDWIPVHALTRIDAAVTNSKWRKVLWRLWHDLPPLHNKENCSLIRSSFYNWIHNRGLRLRALFIASECFENGKLSFQCDYSTLENVIFIDLYDTHSDAVTDIVKRCSSLKVLESRCNSAIRAIPIDILDKIPSIKLYLDTTSGANSILEKLYSCQSIRSLQLAMRLDKSYNSLLSSLFVHCTSLTHFEVRCSFVLLSAIAQQCQHIISLTLEDVDGSECFLGPVTEILIRRSTLEFLSVTCNSFYLMYKRDNYFSLMEYYDSTEDLCTLLSSIRSALTLIVIRGTIEGDQLFPVLHRFSGSLKSLHCSAGIVIGEVVKHIVTHYRFLEEVELWISCDEAELIDAFSVAHQLKRVHFIFEGEVSMKSVCDLFQLLPLLVEFKFECVLRNSDAIEQFRELVLDRFWSNKSLTGHVGFVCDRVLRFRNGRFGGKHVWEFLTHEEREFEKTGEEDTSHTDALKCWS